MQAPALHRFVNFEKQMNIRTLCLVATLAALASPASFAHGDGTHAAMPRTPDAAHAADTPFGRPGDPARVNRTVTVDMTDNMRFTPEVLNVKKGETLRLKVVNKGQVLHELVLGSPEEMHQHAQAMKQSPGMAHDAPQMVHVQPGGRGEMVWQFTQAGEFPFACLLPGHFEAGMRGKVVVR